MVLTPVRPRCYLRDSHPCSDVASEAETVHADIDWCYQKHKDDFRADMQSLLGVLLQMESLNVPMSDSGVHCSRFEPEANCYTVRSQIGLYFVWMAHKARLPSTGPLAAHCDHWRFVDSSQFFV